MKTNHKSTPWHKPVDSKSGKAFTEMTTAELRKATRRYDRPLAMERTSRPLTPSERAEYRRALKGARAKNDRNAKRVSITVRPDLLKRADAYAKRQRMTRSQLIARGLETMIGSAA